MRRSGSSSCMLRPRSSIDDNQELPDQLSVTVINTLMLPTYSTERYYMLSEIELHAHSTQFLCDHDDDCDRTQDTVASSESHEQQEQEQQPTKNHPFPPFVLLYLLWRPDTYPSAKSFTQAVVQESVRRLQNLVGDDKEPSSSSATGEKETDARSEKQIRIYVVVDIVVSQQVGNEDVDPSGARERRYKIQIQIAELLARKVAVADNLRSSVEGITVGLADHLRAAPGLEACMDAILYGSNDRRKFGGGKATSLIGIVCDHPDDLLGIEEESSTDAAQGVLQSRSCAEWNGNGNIQSFARRAHTWWRMQNNIPETREKTTTRRSSRRRRAARANRHMDTADLISTYIVWIFVVGVISYLWNHYREGVHGLLSQEPPNE